MAAVGEARDHYRDDDLWARYVRAFHGGQVEWLGDGYAAVGLPSFRKAHGVTDPGDLLAPPESGEWAAYLAGDVYGIDVERACAFHEDGGPAEWESLDRDCWGYYGDDDAAQAALAELTEAVEYDAARMLPTD